MKKFQLILIFTLLLLFSTINTFAYLNCSVPACPSGTLDNGTVCEGSTCIRSCYAASCSGGWKSVYDSTGNYWDLSYDDFKELTEGSYTPTNKSECYQFVFDAPPADSAYIQINLNGSSPNCESQTIGGFWDLTDKPNPWFSNISYYEYLGSSPGNAKYDYLLRSIKAYVVSDSDQQYMNAAANDSHIYCANNTYACEDIANGTENCAIGCYNREIQIKVAQGRFNNSGSNDYNLFNNLFCGNRYVFNNRYGGAGNKFYLRVYSMPANKTINQNQECDRTNEAPNASLVNVIPNQVTAGENLYCNYTYTDPEGFEEKDSTYEWWKNGSNQNINYRTVYRANLTPGDVWYCKVTPSDGLLNGTKVQSSNNVTVLGTVRNPTMKVNDTYVWNISTYYRGPSFVLNFDDELSNALSECNADAEGYCNISFTFSSEANGILNVTDLEIFYTLPEAAIVSLKVSNLSAIHSSGTNYIYEFVITNNGTSVLSDVSWKLDMGNGAIINSTINSSLAIGEELFVYVSYNYSSAGNYTVVANASATGVSVSISSASTSNLVVQNLSILYDNGLNKVFEFIILNNGNESLSNINWTFDTGESTFSATNLINLSSSEDVRVYVANTYASYGTFTAVASATSGASSDSESISVKVKAFEVTNLSVLNASSNKRVFEFFITNLISSTLTDLSWSFNTANGVIINSTQNTSLISNERMFVYIDYNFTTSGTFNVNASARNGTFEEWQNLTITIT